VAGRGRRPAQRGWVDRQRFYRVLSTAPAGQQIDREITIHILAYKIHDGTLSSELLRPVHPILTSALVYNLAFKALTLIVLARCGPCCVWSSGPTSAA
jgi:hypothetical protein